MQAVQSDTFVYAAALGELTQAGCLAVTFGGHTIALFASEGQVYAVDNRCPHMGFPLQRGTLHAGILTCHWHHARFDIASGGTFDQWADDVPTFPVQVRGGEIWVDLHPKTDGLAHQQKRLVEGLERNISLVTAKAAINLQKWNAPPAEALRTALDFGVRHRRAGWGQGLTMLTCFYNLLPVLETEDQARAVYHGISAVANDSEGMPSRFMIRPLPGTRAELGTLKRWFRSFIELRDAEGAERCVVSALEGGANTRQIADLLFSAATDHRYIQTGHPLDFTNKALEALDLAGWENAAPVLSSLVSGYAAASRMEEANSWRNPIDLVALLEGAFEQLPAALEMGSQASQNWDGQAALLALLLGDDPQASIEGLLSALRLGCPKSELARCAAYAAALRIAQFHTSNEFGDWDTALHTFTFANAVHQGLRRCDSAELVRGVFDAAMSVYLDRYLNIPAARLPEAEGSVQGPEKLLAELPALLDQQQQVNQAGEKIARYLYSGGQPRRIIALLGRLLLREDRNFHTIQCLEAACQQFQHAANLQEGVHILVAAGRYLAAHAPTMRAQGQTYQMAFRLAQGERLFEDG